MSDLYLIAEIAKQRIALQADQVDSVIHVSDIVMVPMAPPHIIGLAAVRSRVITIIDTRIAIGLPSARDNVVLTAVVIEAEGHRYGLVVDRVEDVCGVEGAVLPVRARMGQRWTAISRGILDHAGVSLLVINPDALIAGNLLVAA